jgi:nicotinate phosphoribosyltransferase
MKPLITSNLWNDFYIFTQFQMIFNQFPRAIARYKVQDRQPQRGYPKDMDAKVREQLQMLKDVRTTRQEYDFLMKQRVTKPTCAEYFLGYQFDPDTEVETYYDTPVFKDGYKEVATIQGRMYRTIWWEMPMILLTTAVSSFGMEKLGHWKELIKEKALRLHVAGMNYIDMGTRRAFDMETQPEVVRQCKQYYTDEPDVSGWRGTSNMYLAMINEIKTQGTISHQTYMMMQAAYGFRMSNAKASEHWMREYDGDLGIALPDTLTTEVFLSDFSRLNACAWRGFRLDSANLLDSALNCAAKVRSYDIDPLDKLYVPSDSLSDLKAIAFRDGLVDALGKRAKCTAGIGTFFVNDVGYDPRKVVCKLDAIDIFGTGDWISVVKLSDETGKGSGDPARLDAARSELQLRTKIVETV